MAKWAYDTLLSSSPITGKRFVSSDVVKQGEPSVAFFSLSPQLYIQEKLKARLEEVVAYLGNCYTLFKRSDIVDLARADNSAVKSIMQLDESNF